MVGRTTSSAWISGVVEHFRAVGLDASALLRDAGIDEAALADQNFRIPTEKVSRFWRRAAEVSENPAIGLANPHVPKVGNFDIVAYAMLSSPSLRHALQNFARHMRLVSDAAAIALDAANRPNLSRLLFTLNGGAEPLPRQRVEFVLATLLTFCRWVTGRPLTPVAVYFDWPAPADLAPFEEAFHCPLHFDAGFNGLDFDAADIDADLPGRNRGLRDLHDMMIARRIAVFDGALVSLRARDEIAKKLSGGEPRREEIARALNLSDATFTRRLREEGLSFQQLLDETRRDLARDFLANEQISLAEVAFLLDFSDQSSFFRACRRWFDQPPRRLRSRWAGEGAGLGRQG